MLDAHVGRLQALGQVAGQRLGDLLVQASLEAILLAVAEHPQRVVRDRGTVLQLAGVVGLGEVERLTPGAPGQRAQQLGVLAHEHLVGVEVDQPVAGRGLEGDVARVGERARPLAFDHLRAERAGDLDRRVGRAGVDDHDLIDGVGDRRQAARQHLLLVAHDHAQAQPQAARRLGARRQRQRALGQRRHGRVQRAGACGPAQRTPPLRYLHEVALDLSELWVKPLGGLEQRARHRPGSTTRTARRRRSSAASARCGSRSSASSAAAASAANSAGSVAGLANWLAASPRSSSFTVAQ